MRKVLLVALVVAASACLQSGNPSNQSESGLNQTSSPAPDANSSNVVYLTASGFQPSELTIEQGETVTWINNASSPMWVGSDRHPTHTQFDGTSTNQHCEYPADQDRQERLGNPFDSCASVNEFSYTFEKTGEWGYHNHRSAGQTGTVIVE
jgi:plastocyanin